MKNSKRKLKDFRNSKFKNPNVIRGGDDSGKHDKTVVRADTREGK